MDELDSLLSSPPLSESHYAARVTLTRLAALANGTRNSADLAAYLVREHGTAGEVLRYLSAAQASVNQILSAWALEARTAPQPNQPTQEA